jgi:hypothetical protein
LGEDGNTDLSVQVDDIERKADICLNSFRHASHNFETSPTQEQFKNALERKSAQSALPQRFAVESKMAASLTPGQAGSIETGHGEADDEDDNEERRVASLHYEVEDIIDVARLGDKRNGQLVFQTSWSTGDVDWQPVSSFDMSAEVLLRFLQNVTPKQEKAFKKKEKARLIAKLENDLLRVRTPVSVEAVRARDARLEHRFLVLHAAVRKMEERFGKRAEPQADDPKTVKEAMACDDWDKFYEDAEAEFKHFVDSGAIELVPRPTNKNVVSAKWVFRRKRKNGKVVRWRSRLVCRGFAQQEGKDFDPAELYAPTMRSKSLNVLLHIAARDGMKIKQYDISKAFVHASLEEEVYMEQPALFVVKGKEDYVYRLRNALYGLKQSPRAFGKHLAACMKRSGFEPVDSDECMWVANRGKPNAVYALYHVDDILMASMDEGERDRKFMELRDKQGLSMRDEGIADVFLSIRFVYGDDGSISLSQEHYIEDIAARFGAVSEKRVECPGLPNSTKLSKGDCPVNDQEALAASAVPFPSLIGCLIYAVKTRPDVAFAVSDLAQFMSNWGVKHYEQAMRVLRYLYYTKDQVLRFRKGSGENVLRCYADANYGDSRDGSDNKWKSQGGYLIYIDENLMFWSSKRHRCVTLSSMEAEYVEATKAGQEVLWFRRLLSDLGMPQQGPTVIYEDNSAAISFSKNHTCHDRSKHIDIRHHWLKQMVEDKLVRLVPIATECQIADVLTKYLRTSKFHEFRHKMLGGVTVHTPAPISLRALSITRTQSPQRAFKAFLCGDVWCE